MVYEQKHLTKAFNLIAKEYLMLEPEGISIEYNDLLTLAAYAIHYAAEGAAKEWEVGYETAVYMLKGEITPIQNE